MLHKTSRSKKKRTSIKTKNNENSRIIYENQHVSTVTYESEIILQYVMFRRIERKPQHVTVIWWLRLNYLSLILHK